MELRTGAAAWRQPIPTELTRGPLGTDERCGVAVIGSGLSGALTAFHLAQNGVDVVILDKRPLSTGSTSVSTALIQYEIDVPMVELTSRLGLADAQAVYRTTRGALDDMRTLIEENDFECDFKQRPTLYLARRADDILHLRHEALAREEIGIEATFLNAAELRDRYRIDRPGAIRSSVSYEMNPRKLAAGLLSAAVACGARIYDRTALTRDNVTRPSLVTTDGHRVDANHVVFATGYETVERFPELREHCSLKTTYALATRPLPREDLWPERALLWEMANPYFYARTTPDDRVMIGGEDDGVLDPAEREKLLPTKARRLLERLEVTVGLRGAKIDRSWAATFALTEDGLPIIGAHEDAPCCCFNLGFGGNGIIFGLIGAQIIRDRIAGQHHPATSLFGFRRFENRDHAPCKH
jgi:glycine/D-amino acid oxidase-like deaminating enzyme